MEKAVRCDDGSFVFTTRLPHRSVHQFKWIIDDSWRCDESLPITSDGLGELNNVIEVVEVEKVPTAPVQIKWSDHSVSPSFVSISGSFNNWSSQWALERNSAGEFLTSLQLPSGRHVLKFVVDGVWRHSPDLEYASDGLGGFNNYIDV